MIRFYLVIGWLLIGISALAQPCVRVVNTEIPDNERFYTSRIEASTITSGNRILCGVRLSFTHQFVNELRFVLQSPSGKRVVLTAGKTSSAKTSGSTFDVLFIRGDDTPNPDAFKKPVWQDNKWEENQSYIGSYYPDGEAGLEHFDGDRMTGTWNLIFADLVSGGKGSLESFELIFCDPPSFCNPCSVPRDFVVDQDFGSFCGGDPRLFDVRPTFYSSNLTSGYENTFLVVNQGNRIVARGSNPDLSNLPKGTYTIVGLQYRAANAAEIAGINNLNRLTDLFYGNQATLCGAISNTSATIKILSNPGYQENTLEVYGRDFIIIDGQRITSDQIISQEYTDINGCDSLVRTSVEFKEYVPKFTQDHQYNCDHTSINVSVTTEHNFEIHRWFTKDGRISNQSDLNSQQVIVNSPGTYFVVFKIQDYLDTVEYELDVDPASPVISLANEYALCSATPLSLTIGTNFDEATLNPSSSATIDGNTLTIHEPDLYTLIVSNGECDIVKHILVKPPEIGEDVLIPDGAITCPGVPVEIEPTLNRDYENYSWYHAGNEVASTRKISASTPGLYTFRAYDGNQCGSTGTVWVEDNSMDVDLRIDGTTLINCTNQGQENQLTASFQGDFDIKWTLPDGSQRTEQTVSITDDGTYSVEISDGMGCVISESASITTDLTKIDFDVPTEVVIPCDVPLARIVADISANPIDYNIKWEGALAGNPATNAIVDQPGTVRVTVEHLTSQCQTTKTIEVTEKAGKPKLDIGDVATAITCEDPIRRIPLSITDCADCKITLNTLENIEIKNDTLIAREPGTAYITLDGTCVSEYEIHFPDQTKATPLDLEVRNIGCSNTNGSILVRNENAYRSIQFQSSTETFEYSANNLKNISSPVTYTVVYTDKVSGCVGRQTVEVKVADQAPNTDFEPVQYLDCATGVATLRVRGTGIGRIIWTHPDGQTSEPQDKILVVREAGTYQFVALNANNCYVEGEIEVRDDRSTPTVGLSAEYTIPCSDEDGLVHMTFDTSSLASTQWYGPGGLVSSAFHPTLGPGNYQVVIEGKNGCRSTEETTIVQEAVGAGPDIIAPPITCLRDFSRVHLDSYDNVAEIQWIDESGQASVSDSFDVFNPGRISLVIKQQNGCLISRTMIVEEDTDVVPFTINKPIINCHNLNPVLRVQTPDSVTRSIDYQWYIADIPIGNDPTYDIQYPGIYRVEVAFDNGCVDSAMHTVELDTSAVELLLETDTITCARSKIQLSNDIPVDHIESASWTGPDGFTSKAKRPNFQIPGLYTVTYAGKNGCQAEAEMEIYNDQYAPQLDSVGFLSLGCGGKAVDLTYFSQDSVTTQYWLIPSGQTLEDSIVKITAKGNYLLYLEGDNGCSKIDTFFIDQPVSPYFELDVEAAGCDDQMGQATVFPELDTFETIWYEPGTMTELGRGSESPQLPVGSYLVTVVNPYNNCDSTTVVEVVDISSVMNVELSVDDSLRCERTEANLIANVYPTSEHYVYEWRYASSGTTISTDTIASGVSAEGNYSFTARDTINQCVVDGVYRNVRAPSRLRYFDLFLTEPACNINRAGRAIMDSLIGASNMNLMTYSVNGGPFREQDTFPFLYANETYHITAKDQYGCTLDTTLFPQLRGIMDRTATIPDTTINSGDSLDFNDPAFKIEYVSTDAPLSEQYTWILNPDTLTCDYDCQEQIQHRFFETRTVTSILTNEYGCTITDTFNVYVREGDVLNVPNAIIPASNTVGSAHACIYTNQYVRNVEMYIIFNRRGNVVFKQSNFSPQNPHQQLSSCWDGRDQQGHIHPPGNYNYYVKYTTVYGEVKEKYGNILLIR